VEWEIRTGTPERAKEMPVCRKEMLGRPKEMARPAISSKADWEMVPSKAARTN
jgi:hypothetical protein